MVIWHNYVMSFITNGLFISIWSTSKSSLSPILSCYAFHNSSVFLFLADVKLCLCFQQPASTLANLPLKRGSLRQLICRLFIYISPWHKPLRALSAIPQRQDDAYLELLSHSFSLEISIITKPPTVKRLSKNARHLATQKSSGLTRGGEGRKKHAYIK